MRASSVPERVSARGLVWWLVLAGMLAPWLARAAACASPPTLPAGWRVDPRAGQVLVEGQSGGLRPFWMDRTEVTNGQFAAFVLATGHVTDAERQGAAAVFVVPSAQALYERPLAWWRMVKGANWRQPEGPGSSIRGKSHHPVVQVTRVDALAYARWLGRDLPTESEWTWAAAHGRLGSPLPEGPRDSRGRPTANYWQGSFPLLNTKEDGHAGLAPVACYGANPQGLFDMIGNAWEWTADDADGDRQAQAHANGDPALLRRTSAAPPKVIRGIIKGGSFLCAPDYCVRYEAAAREAQEADLPTAHVGFRTVSREPSAALASNPTGVNVKP